ncbi:MAG: glycosyltransferase [Bacteroidales bacterium]|nr:glycosyltransferase [Bacteroidales bacterium]
MNVLLLCNKSPFPPKEGGPIAMNAVIEGLIRANHHVKVLAINTNKYFIDVKKLPEEYITKTGLETVYIDLSIKPLDAFLNLFSSKSYHVQRFVSNEFKDKLIEILKKNKFDIVQIELLYLATYVDVVRKFSNAKIVLRAHNIEHLIWERIATNCRNPVKKFYLNHLYKTLRNFELSALKKFDGIAAITKKDAEYFISTGCNVPIIDLPFGIQFDDYQLQDIKPEIPSLFHLGSMNWMPNEEGIRWFLDKAWPLIHHEFPELKFYLAGRMMPDWLLKAKIPNVEVVGEVENALNFIQSKMIMIVPLFSGSGIRIKIIEGMTAGKPIISTSIGAEGINYENGKNILIADTPEEYLESVRNCINNEQYCFGLGENARKLIEKEHNNELLIERLTNFYLKISL